MVVPVFVVLGVVVVVVGGNDTKVLTEAVVFMTLAL